MDDIKSTLYQLLAKTRNLQPKYQFSSGPPKDPGGPPEYYECKLTVFGFDYEGYGEEPSKKGAQTRAAEQFCRWLVYAGHYPATEFPQLFPKNAPKPVSPEPAEENGADGPPQPPPPQQPPEDLKCILYAVLGRKKMSAPEYIYHRKNDGRQYFECECRVAEFPQYVAKSDRAQTKKAAQNEAAENMARWLVDNGHLPLDQFPQLQAEALARENEPGPAVQNEQKQEAEEEDYYN